MLGTHRIKGMAAVLAAIMVCGVLIASVQGANVPEMINYQGYLETGGVPVTVPTDLRFRIYDQDAGGTMTWGPETQAQVQFDNGYFSVMLGSAGVPLEAIDLNGSERWLEIEIAPFTGPMTPRIQLTSVPFAHRVATVDGASGGDIYGDVALHSDFTLNGRIGIGTPNPLKDLHISRNDLPTEIQMRTVHTGLMSWTAWDIVSGDGKLNFRYRQHMEPPSGYDPTMTLNHEGKVGIGTESPEKDLTISRSSGPSVVRLESTSGADVIPPTWDAWDIQKDGDLFQVLFDDPNYSYLPTLTIHKDGMVGINATNPQYTLDVAGDIRATGTIHGTADDADKVGGNHVVYKQVEFNKTEYIVNTSWVKMYTYGTALSLKIENPIGSGYGMVCYHSDNFGQPTGVLLAPGDVQVFPFSGAFHDIRIVSQTHLYLLTFSGAEHNGVLHGHVTYND